MSLELDKIIKRIAASTLGDIVRGSYHNEVYISGFVLTKPTIIRSPKKTSCSFIVWQFLNDRGTTYAKTFNVFTYNLEIINAIEQQTKCFFVDFKSTLYYNKARDTYYPQAYNMEIKEIYNADDLVPLEKRKGDKK